MKIKSLDELIHIFKKHKNKTSITIGVISGLAFAPTFTIPTLFTLSILCFQVKCVQNIKDSFVLGLLFGFGHFLVSMYWISIGVSVYINEFWWAIPFALFGIPLVLAFFIAVSCSISWIFKDSYYYHFIFCLSFVFCEWLRSWVLSGLPWNLVGYALSVSDTLVQIVNVIGVYGLGFLIVYICSTFYYLLNKQYKELTVSIIVSIIIVLSLIIYGYFRLSNNPTQYTNIKIRLVQPSIPQTDKWDVHEFWRNLDTHIKISLQDSDDVDLIIWSEAALTAPYRHPQIQPYLMKHLLSKSKAVLITGGISGDDSIEDDAKVYTTMYAINKNKDVLFEYYKSHLVPFGEYIPLRAILPFKKLTYGFLDYTPGKPGIFYLKELDLRIKPLICYESIFPGEVRVENSLADVFINITNDAWYGNSSGPYQHLEQSRMRAIENGIPMIRVGNNGISAIIDPFGRIIKSLKLNEVNGLNGILPKKIAYTTIYSIMGELMVIVSSIAILMIQVLIKRLRHCCVDRHCERSETARGNP